MGPRGALALDVDHDDRKELLLVAAGLVTAERWVSAAEIGQQVWRAEGLNAVELVGTADLDLDERDEIVARSNDRVFILRAADGQVLWAEPHGEMGTIGGVRLADLDRDGATDLLVQECGCCGVNSGTTGFAYRFSGGGATIASPALLWELPSVACGGYAAMTIVRTDPEGPPQVVLGYDDGLDLLDGATGAVVATTGAIGSLVQASQCVPVDVDDTGGEELLCVLSDPAPADGLGRRAWLLGRQPSSTMLEVRWERLIGDQPGAVSIPASPVARISADGTLGLALTGRVGAGTPVTYLCDVLTGEILAQVYGQTAVGLVGSAVDEPNLLLTTSDAQDLFAWSYDPSQSPPLRLVSGLTGRTLATHVDWSRAARSSVSERPLVVDLDLDGSPDVATLAVGTASDLSVYSTTGGTLALLGSFQAPDGVSVLRAWAVEDVVGAGTLVAVALSDGNLHLLDDSLAPVSGTPSVGVRFGGFYAPGSFRQLKVEPIVAQLWQDMPDAILSATSRGAVEALDASTASLAVGPRQVWTRDKTAGPVALTSTGETGARVLAVESTDANQHAIVALDAAGSQRWRTPLQGVTLADLVPARLDGDNVADIFVQWGFPGQEGETVLALAGDSGATLLDGPWIGQTCCQQPAGAAAADWDADGIDDLIYQANATMVMSGATGTILASSPPATSYAMPGVRDLNDDGQLDVALFAAMGPLRALDHDLQTVIWESAQNDLPFLYAAQTDCSSVGPVLISTSRLNTARLRVTDLAPPDLGGSRTIVLAGGNAFPDEESAASAGASLGQLASPAVHNNLSGDGRPIAVVGSSDGWLYGVDICAADLRFALRFGSPVGSVAFGDTDGDGKDDMVVSAADGFLYGVKNAPCEAPSAVADLDPGNLGASDDIDDVTTYDTLRAGWAPVDGAEGYELAIVRGDVAGGGYLTDPPWVAVEQESYATITGLPLQNGVRYHAAVRARCDGEASPDAVSDGVVVHLTGEAGTGGQGGATTGTPTTGTTPPLGSGPLLVGRSCVYFCAVGPQRPDPIGALYPLAWLLAAGLRRSRRGRGA